MSTYDPLPFLASSPMPPSTIFSFKLELKHLPNSLNYVFLRPKETLYVIFSSLLSYDQDKELISVLSEHKRVIGWSIANLKGISLTICMHRIHSKDDTNPVRQIQLKLNPHVKEVISKKVVKLLNAGIIYPIPNS